MSIFSRVPKTKVPSSNHNLSFEKKMSMNFGTLVPTICEEVLPGDRMKVSTELLIKFAPLKAPVMHRLKAKIDYFFVPEFQISQVFQDFINPKVNTDQNPVVLPYLEAKDLMKNLPGYGTEGFTPKGSLLDYLGLPILNNGLWTSNKRISVRPMMAYQHIYNSFYRDQNLEPLEGANPASTSLFMVDEFLDSTGNLGQSSSNQLKNLLTLRSRAWKKDYFTSALPSPQAGEDVMIPLSSGWNKVYPLRYNGEGELEDDDYIRFDSGVGISGSHTASFVPDEHGETNKSHLTDGPNNSFIPTNLYAQSPVSDLSVNLFRQLIQLQGFKEIAARGGTRYPEVVRNFFNAYLPDYWFGRPLFLGGQVQPINIGEVVQTSQSTDGESGSAQGYRAGIASSYGFTKTFKLKAPCHGFLMGLLTIIPEATYQQGLERMWTRESLYDFAFPQFANLGEQEILNQEIYADGSENDTKVFGYAPRYAEYKEGHTMVCGEFRDSLDYWHFGRVFATRPKLNKKFVMMDQMDYSPFNVTDAQTEHVYVDLYNNIHSRRPLPYFSRPATL